MADGWSNIKRDSIVNIVLTMPEPVFFKSISCGAERHTAEYTFEVLAECIEEVGPEKVSALVTDNAANMKAAWQLIKKKYPHILAYGCVAHGLNLLFTDIAKIDQFKNMTLTVQGIIKEIRNSHFLLAKFKEHQASCKITRKGKFQKL